jgi:aspartate carbamoyltransferase catalytic subunit
MILGFLYRIIFGLQLFFDRERWPFTDVLESQQFDRHTIERLFRLAEEMRNKKKAMYKYSLKGLMIALLFYEPSTRTRLSFESAAKRLGIEVMGTENAREFSSAAKGESIGDTARTISGYVDAIVLRHFKEGSSKLAAAFAHIPVLNAGDGPGQHPTQALLDLYTIWRKFGTIDGLKIAMVGDLKNGRTVHSLAYMLGKFFNVTIYFVSPEELRIPDGIKEYLARKKVAFEEMRDFHSILGEVDVIYMTRIQKERFENPADYERLKGSYILGAKEVAQMHIDAIVMHPLPRVDEISEEVDLLPNAMFFEQAWNGVYMRMALLWALLGSRRALLTNT